MQKIALVTGGSRGIGLGIAHELAKSGFNIAINGRREISDVADAIKSIEANGVEALYCRGDVTRADERKSILDLIQEHFGRLDVLVNNAGVAPDKRADILEARRSQLRSTDQHQSQRTLFPHAIRGQPDDSSTENRQQFSRLHHQRLLRQCHRSPASIGAIIASAKPASRWPPNYGRPVLTEFGIAVFEVRPGIIATDMTSGRKRKVRQADRRRAAAGETLGYAARHRQGRRLPGVRAMCPTHRGRFWYWMAG